MKQAFLHKFADLKLLSAIREIESPYGLYIKLIVIIFTQTIFQQKLRKSEIQRI